MHVGNIVQGARMAWAKGRDLGLSDEESESRKVRGQSQGLESRSIPGFVLYSVSWCSCEGWA